MILYKIKLMTCPVSYFCICGMNEWMNEKDSQNSPWKIIQREDFVAYSHHAKSEAEKFRWVLGMRENVHVSINTFICGLKPILPPVSRPSKSAYHHRNCFRKCIIRSFHDDLVKQNFRWPAAASCGWMASELAFREPQCLFLSPFLMTRTDLVLKTLVRLPSSHLTRLLAI